MEEETTMKYVEIETLIDREIEKVIVELDAKHKEEIASLKQAHEKEIEQIKDNIKAEIIAKINE